jgi:hypothetical protein
MISTTINMMVMRGWRSRDKVAFYVAREEVGGKIAMHVKRQRAASGMESNR